MKKLISLACLSFLFFFANAQTDSLKEYAGTYKFPEGSPTPSVDVTVQDGSLYISSSIGSAPMTHANKDTFNIPDYYNALVVFSRNSDGKVKSIRIDAGGNILEGEKQAASTAWLRGRMMYHKSLAYQPATH